jgi:hypothetical protein
MPKPRPPYPPEPWARLIEPARTGRTPKEFGRRIEQAQAAPIWSRAAAASVVSV